MRVNRIVATVLLASIALPSQACDLRINDADVMAQKLLRYFDTAFPANRRLCDAKPDNLRCHVEGTKTNLTFERQKELGIALFSSGSDSGPANFLKDLWAEVSPHIYFGAFERPADADIAAAIEGRGPAIFIRQDHCALVLGHKSDSTALIVMGGYRK